MRITNLISELAFLLNSSPLRTGLWDNIHTYQSRFIPEGVAEASQIFLREAHVLPKLLSYE
jgi:hypothetical protein